MPDAERSERLRVRAFAALSALAALATAAYVWHAARRASPAPVAKAAVASAPRASAAPAGPNLESLLGRPHVAYRSVRDGEFGRVVVADLAAPNEARVVLDVACDRIHFGTSAGVCMVDTRTNPGAPAFGLILDARGKTTHRFPLAGLPSRTRVSRDQKLGATTVFVTGDDYEAEFSTRTTLFELASGRTLSDLEELKVYDGKRVFRRVDFNFWGVTFSADPDAFFATLRSGGETRLVRGSVAKKELRVLRKGVECPSLSPDGRRIAFKKKTPDGNAWRLHVLTLDTLLDRPIAAETRSIDDQVEWLDDEHVLYGIIEERGRPADAMNVWVSPVGGKSGEPARIFLRAASSPSVVRP